jgi:Ti-type conjugative transfer relaxase TraA
MAIYHLSVKVISRATGRSSVAAAAYRSASRLHDDRLDRDHDFSNKPGVVHSKVLLPDGAPEEWHDRERLWNDVENFEKRKDAQLSREVEFAIPREMSEAQGVELARDFAQREFVDLGMIADLNVHWDIGADGQPKPHGHVMLTMRDVNANGFGQKVREWNRTALVERWRERWAEHVNSRLAELDIDARVDHRSLEAQGIELEPQHKIGPAGARRLERGEDAERAEGHARIARENGARIIANPGVALDAITHQQATFTRRDLAMFVHRHSEGKEQFDAAMSAVQGSPDCVELGQDGRGEDRFTSRDMIETEQRLQRAAELMAQRERHRVSEDDRKGALARAEARGLLLSGEQRAAFEHVTDGRGLGVVIGYAGTGKSAMLGVAREAWEEGGWSVRGLALSGIAAENLESGSGIASRTIASMEHGWAQGRDMLSGGDVLVIDEAGMVGSRQMERVLSHAAEAGAKVVLVGDAQQLQAIEAGAAFRAIHERHGGVEIIEVRRQCIDWQRDATRQLATGRTGEAIRAYEDAGHFHVAETRKEARGELVYRWNADRQSDPDDTRIILTHTNDEVRGLNELARERLREAGALGEDVKLATARGERYFAPGDRIMFLRNERSLGVKNGSLGTVEQVSERALSVRLDNGGLARFDVKDYADIDHGYAATIHKAQGITVDRVHVLATPGLDSHASYVALSRHRDGVELHYGKDDFADQRSLVRTLARERAKDMASDYEPTQRFAERRGIGLRERVADIVRKAPEKMRGMFDGLKLAPQRTVQNGRSMFDGLKLNIAPNAATAAPSPLERAVERYARAAREIVAAQREGGRELPHQRAAFETAGKALDAIRPEAGRDMRNAFNRDLALVDAAANGRTRQAIRAMMLEAEVRTDPSARADRFVEDWRKLASEERAYRDAFDDRRASKLRSDMGVMAKSLERDPQVESLLRKRLPELGIKMPSRASLSHDLQQWLGRSRGLGIGM